MSMPSAQSEQLLFIIVNTVIYCLLLVLDTILNALYALISITQPTPVILPGKSHGQRKLEAYSPWGRKELDTTERLSMHA